MPPKQSKSKLREQRGRSIIQNATKAKAPSHNVITDRTIRTPNLGDQIMADLRALYPYMQDAPGAGYSFDKLVYNFQCDTYPEGEVFWWQLQVISVLHALNLWDNPTLPRDRPPPPAAKSLGDHVVWEIYERFPRETRQKFHKTVFMLLMVPEGFSVDCPEDLCILEATKDVCDARREESAKIEKGRAIRYAKAYGAACYACKSMGKGKMVCSRCKKVFYCGRECQKAHWPEHKKECSKKPIIDEQAAKEREEPTESLMETLLKMPDPGSGIGLSSFLNSSPPKPAPPN